MFKTHPDVIARKICKKNTDAEAIALFDSDHNLVAYAIPPSIAHIEHFRTQGKKRIMLSIILFMVVMYCNLYAPIISILSLAFIGYNTFYGWDKYRPYCQSVFALNSIITVISYGVAINYVHIYSHASLAIKGLIITNYFHITPVLILLMLLTCALGYIISIMTIGNIDTLTEAERQKITLKKLVANQNIEKYVISENGEYNQLHIKLGKKKMPAPRKSFRVDVSQNTARLRK